MTTLLGQLSALTASSRSLDTNHVALAYLIHGAQTATDRGETAGQTLSIAQLVDTLNTQILDDARFSSFIDDKTRTAITGVVLDVSSSISAGNYVDVNHGMLGGNSVITEYLHMQRISVSPGQSVSAGTVLGEVGMTGYVTGCHLHFGVLQNGVNVDPMGYL